MSEHTLKEYYMELNGKAPSKIQIFPPGEVRINGASPVIMDKLAFENVIAAIEPSYADIVIDYEHQSINGGVAPAAGWLKRDGFSFDEEGGFNGTCVWTKRAKEYIENFEYRYFSPYFYSDRSTKRIIRLVNVGLTNLPRMLNITPIVAKSELTQEIQVLKDTMIQLSLDLTKKEMKTMSELKKLREHLKVGDDVTDEELVAKVITDLDAETETPDFPAIIAKALAENPAEVKTEEITAKLETVIAKMGMQAIRKRIKADEKTPDALVEQQVIRMLDELDKLRKQTAAKAVLDALELPEGSNEDEVIAKVHILAQKPDLTDDLKILKGKLDVLEAEKNARDTADLIRLGVTMRKITPAVAKDCESWACSLAKDNPKAFKKFLDQAPEIIAKEDVETPLVPKQEDTEGDAEAMEIAAKAGLDLTDEDWKKYGGDEE